MRKRSLGGSAGGSVPWYEARSLARSCVCAVPSRATPPTAHTRTHLAVLRVDAVLDDTQPRHQPCDTRQPRATYKTKRAAAPGNPNR